MLTSDRKKMIDPPSLPGETSSGATVIGSSLVITGEIRADEDCNISGQHHGKIDIKNHTLTVAKSAFLQSEIHAKHVHLLGKVEGTIHASGKVEIRSGAEMTGDIYASRISIEDGAQYKGSVKMNNSPSL